MGRAGEEGSPSEMQKPPGLMDLFVTLVCSAGFVGAQMSKRITSHTLNMCSLLHVSLTSGKLYFKRLQ